MSYLPLKQQSLNWEILQLNEDLKCHPIPEASNEDDLDDVPIDGHEEGKF